MSTVRAGQRSALLVVDVQVGVMSAAWQAADVIAQVAQAVKRARAEGVPIVWVQHEADDLPRGSDAWQWVAELAPGPLAGRDEVLIGKRHESAFEGTELEATLARWGITHLVLCGASSNWCIRATAYAALERGYDLSLLSDAHTTTSIDLGDGRTIDAATLVADMNVVLRWLSYPGRRCEVARAAAVAFARAAA